MQRVRVQHVVPQDPESAERRSNITQRGFGENMLIERMEQVAQGVRRCANTVRAQQSRDDQF
jgi:hypothetical protein